MIRRIVWCCIVLCVVCSFLSLTLDRTLHYRYIVDILRYSSLLTVSTPSIRITPRTMISSDETEGEDSKEEITIVIEKIEEVVKGPRKESLLPSWVLNMRSKIEASRLIYQDAEDRLLKINEDVSELTNKLQKLQPSLSQVSVSDGKADTSAAPLPAKNSERAVDQLLLHWLADELIREIFQHLSTAEVCRMRGLSRKYRSLLTSLDYWRSTAFLRYSFLFTHHTHYDLFSPTVMTLTSLDEVVGGRRAYRHYLDLLRRRCEREDAIAVNAHICGVIERYHRESSECQRFLSQMKEQRCVPKHKQVHPRRHHRSERGVTHPLPLFDSSTLMASDKIMSPSETLNSDFRSFAHHILEVLIALTSRLFDDFNNRLVEEGVVTVLVSLLANEEATVQNYACAVLGNLLCWESVAKTKTDVLRSHSSDADCEVRRYKIALIDQITTCNGHRQLALLLTSPSASVNLAVGKHYNHYNPPTLPDSGRASTSNIQGVCNKQASRALIGLFYPDAPVFSRTSHTHTSDDWLSERRESNKPSSDLSTGISVSTSVGGEGEAPYKSIWKFTTPLPPIQSMSSSDNISLLKPSPRHRHYLNNNPTASAKTTTSSSSIPLPQAHSTHQPLSPLQLFLLTDDTARAWQFTYFYKSGAFKDQFPAFLRFFSADCIRGKGVDAIGFFTLEGRIENDIIGQKVLLSKTYHHHIDTSDVAHTMREEKELRDIADPLLSTAVREDREGVSQAHVRHLGYWSEGVVFSMADNEGCGSDYWRQCAEKWSLGLWGVWETCTSQPHYELQKGGVFRMTPAENLE